MTYPVRISVTKGRLSGYQLMTAEQQREIDGLTERAAHRDTMRFTALDAADLAEYEALCERLEWEYQKDAVVARECVEQEFGA